MFKRQSPGQSTSFTRDRAELVNTVAEQLYNCQALYLGNRPCTRSNTIFNYIRIQCKQAMVTCKVLNIFIHFVFHLYCLLIIHLAVYGPTIVSY
jgi:hypothetical protein